VKLLYDRLIHLRTVIMNYLDRRRKEGNISQTTLAKALGTKQSVVSELLSGAVKNPGLLTVFHLLSGLKIRATLILWRNDYPDLQLEVGHTSPSDVDGTYGMYMPVRVVLDSRNITVLRDPESTAGRQILAELQDAAELEAHLAWRSS
jgi:transcriptional regulator with XRE-family HTH domain